MTIYQINCANGFAKFTISPAIAGYHAEKGKTVQSIEKVEVNRFLDNGVTVFLGYGNSLRGKVRYN